MESGLSGRDMVSAVEPGAFLKVMNELGQYVAQRPVPVGTYRVLQFMIGLGRAHFLLPGEGVMCYPPDQRHAPSDFGEEHYRTAAVQNFQVDRQERDRQRSIRIERMLARQERNEVLRAEAQARADATAKAAAEEKAAAEKAALEKKAADDAATA